MKTSFRAGKKLLSLLLAVCLVLAMLPTTAFAEEGTKDLGAAPGDSGAQPSLTIGVSGITGTGATLEFTADQDGTVYYLIQKASEDEPGMDPLKASSSVRVTAGTPAAIEVKGLLAGTDYTVYGVVVGGDLASGSDAGGELVSPIVSESFAAPVPGRRSAPKPAGISLMGAAAPGTQVLNEAWKTDVTNGFSEPTALVDSSQIRYEWDSIWLESSATAGEWIEFSASPSEGLEEFDLTSLTLGKYNDDSIVLNFTITGTQSGGGTVSESFSWPSGDGVVKTFSGLQFAGFTQLTKFKITLQNVSTLTWYIEFREFTIANPAGSGNTPPVLSGLTAITFLENEINAAFRQVDSDVTVTDADSADFDGGQITVSYTGTPLGEDQLSIGNIGNISLSGSTVSYAGVGQIGAVSGGVNGAPLIITLNANATPARTSELLRAITYKNTSNEPTSHRTLSITVSDGDGGASVPATAKISVSGQAESGVEVPTSTQNVNLSWADDLNNGFSVQGNGGVTVTGDATCIWMKDPPAATASFHIAAAEQFAGGMFDLTGLVFDVFGSGKTYTVTIIGYKPNASTVTATKTGSDSAALAAIDLSGMKGIVAFDFQVAAPTPVDVECVGLDAFTIANPGTANAPPAVTGLPSSITVTEDIAGNVDLSAAAFSDADGDILTVTLAASVGTFTASSGGSVMVGGSGTGTLTLSGTAVNLNTYLDTASNIRYTGAPNANGTGAASIAVTASDGKITPLLGTISVNITAVNDDPTITGLPASITVTENTAGNVDFSAASFSDVDSGGDNVTLSLSVDKGTLTALPGGGVLVYEAGGMLALNGSAANIDAYLKSSNINYTGPAGLSGNSAATLTLTANDHGYSGGGGGGNIALGTISIHITELVPTVTNVTSSTANGAYAIGSVINIVLTFTKHVIVVGTPRLSLNSGGTAAYASGSGTNTLTFTYTVQEGNTSADLDYTATGALSLNGGTIQTASGTNAILALPAPGATGSLGANKSIVIDGIAPTVIAVSVPADGTYRVGETLTFMADFSKPVMVTTAGGTPYCPLLIGSTPRQADYAVGSGTSALVFQYTVQHGDLDADGVGTGAALALNGGTIRDAVGNPAVLALNSVGSTSGVRVDAVPPTLVSAARADDTHIVVALNKPCWNLAKANNGGFTVTKAGTSTAYAVLSTDAGIGNTVVLTVDDIGGAGAAGVIVTYTKGGNGTIADTAGNPMETDSVGVAVSPWIAPPSAPTGVTATVGNKEATVSFTPPVSDGGAAVTSYTVTASPGGITATGNASPITVTGLTNGTTYTFTVAAMNTAGKGMPSTASNSVTPLAPSTGGGTTTSPTPRPTISIAPESRPGQPVTAVAPITATAGANGTAGATVPDQLITDAIAKAQAEAKAQGKAASNIAVALNITLPEGASSLSAALSKSALQSLIKAGVKSLTVNSAPMPSVTLDLKALKAIQKQSGGGVTITISSAPKLSKSAQQLIGDRPVYGVAASYIKRGKTRVITTIGGTGAVSIPYVLRPSETAEQVFGVSLDSRGRAARVKGSYYDAASGCIIIPVKRLSAGYGVGHAAPR